MCVYYVYVYVCIICICVCVYNMCVYNMYMCMCVYTRIVIIYIGMFCFSTSYVPLDTLNHTLNEESMLIYKHVLHIVDSTKANYSSKFKIFALNVLYNILSTHPGMYICV